MISQKVVVVNLSSSGSRIGGAAIAAEFHSRYMAMDYPVELWRMWDKDEYVDLQGLKVRNYLTTSKLRRLKTFFPHQLGACFLTSKILDDIRKEQPDIIHLQNPLPALVFEEIAYTASCLGIKTVASTHGFFEILNPNYGFKKHEKIAWKYLITQPILRALNYIDTILSGYPQEREMLISCGIPQEKISLVPNGVNPFFLASPSESDYLHIFKKFHLKEDRPILLFIGNHTANKGLDTIMKVAGQLSQPATLVVGGKLLSPDEPRQWQVKLPTNSKVNLIFTDFLSLEEQRALYYLSTLLLFPSVSDTLPLTIIEAMASGLPVVAYDVGGISYQLANNSGSVIRKGEFANYLQSVESLLSDQDQRSLIAKNAKARQQKIFSWASAAQKTISVYQTLLD
ncbi:glycosyltransferase family 4 protein [Acaryochloris sp. 'Moss Beach']|uniref:glycosyltransferase family 4 protein n=1 Tax=Acaryochloris sp. 'Moss Beach' TaxID=2740837 RepID=UPI001F165AA9|nr:glycosyltransferase family 4 protein [Acaryochloris sp. 'Moss Beach']UJB67900.1 glycosyltransferase family 4 protein [Acaryochloris sp. 'Moss Beach']